MAETAHPLIGALKAAGRFAWDVLIPHFETNVVALHRDTDGAHDVYSRIGLLDELEESEYNLVDAVVEADCFVLLGIVFEYRLRDFTPVRPLGIRRVP